LPQNYSKNRDKNVLPSKNFCPIRTVLTKTRETKQHLTILFKILFLASASFEWAI